MGITKGLALAGTTLIWLPLLAPLLLALAALLMTGRWLFDYLMPAELFLVALAGGGLLLWAALRAQARRWLIATGLGGAAALLVGSQALAVVTGLATGETAPGGWAWAAVLAALAGYALALGATGVGGALLLRDLFGRQRPAPR
jgi:hypothetical protein